MGNGATAVGQKDPKKQMNFFNMLEILTQRLSVNATIFDIIQQSEVKSYDGSINYVVNLSNTMLNIPSFIDLLGESTPDKETTKKVKNAIMDKLYNTTAKNPELAKNFHHQIKIQNNDDMDIQSFLELLFRL